MADRKFKVGDQVCIARPGCGGSIENRMYRIKEVGVCNMYRLDGKESWFSGYELLPCAGPDAPFKVGDMVVRVDDHSDEPVAQKVAEVTGSFIRLYGNNTYDDHELLKAWKRPEETVVIRTDGDTTRAYLKRGGKIVSETKCRRMKDDKHDLKIVSALALDRLMPKDDREIVVRESGYYGAVAVAHENPYSTRSFSAITTGMIMEFFGGKWKDAPVLSVFRSRKYNSFPELKEDFAKYGYTVIELHR